MIEKKTDISRIEALCSKKGIKITHQRSIIANVISESDDHPDANEVFIRANKIDKRISLATVYRTIKVFEENNVLNRIDFGGKRARYEELTDNHHDHLIDVDTGEIIEFLDNKIEELQKKVAKKHGYLLVDHKMELFGKKIDKTK
ncbi:MAG: transcriptional repressor [Rickettsiales bacterium TMED251]|nr:MAG: transcriptional repressor [Rickettsiales bacterium TMED251]|tara:strand:- start:1 stop:435 length:435 start_codon:yes stop_codon:yes gene_type:complete